MRIVSTRIRARSEEGKASLPVVVGGVALSVTLILVAVTFVQERKSGSAAKVVDAGAVRQAAQERDVEAARQKYRRELLYCDSLRQFAGADTACLADFAVEYKDSFFCDEVPSSTRWECSQVLARATGRSELCDAVPNPWMKWDCYLDTAAASADAKSCDRILDAEAQRRRCEEAGGGDICGELNAENGRQNYKACVAVARRDMSACEAVTSKPARLGCFRRVAVQKRDPSLCENVRDRQLGEVYQALLYECWKDVAVATARIEDCDRIPHEGVRINTSGTNTWNDCRHSVEVRQTNAPCREKGPWPLGPDLTCYGKMAAAKNDLRMCQKGSSYSKDICAITFAFRKNDGSACTSISEERLATACLEITGRSGVSARGATERR